MAADDLQAAAVGGQGGQDDLGEHHSSKLWGFFPVGEEFLKCAPEFIPFRGIDPAFVHNDFNQGGIRFRIHGQVFEQQVLELEIGWAGIRSGIQQGSEVSWTMNLKGPSHG